MPGFANILWIVLAAGSAPSGPPRAACPSDDELRRSLAVEGKAWRVVCNATKNDGVEMAAVLPPATPAGAARVVVSVLRNDLRLRSETVLDGPERQDLEKTGGEDWKIAVRPAGIRGATWLRVDVIASGGDDYFSAQSVVSFFRIGTDPALRVWTGLGDRNETRFDACRLDTTARFDLSRNGELVRTRRTTRSFRRPGGIDSAQLKSLETECVASPRQRETFAVDDDGLDGDVPGDDALRKRARANRLLFLRARESDQALARFVADSFALIDPLTNAVTNFSPADPERGFWETSTAGAFAYVIEGGVRNGLNWERLLAVAKPSARRLLQALRGLRGDDELGAWIEAQTDLGGCQRPEKGERPLAAAVDAWNAAPEPVRDAFREYLVGQLTEMVGYPCFCDAKTDLPKIQRAVERNAAILDGLPELGPPLAEKLRASPQSPNAAFKCVGPH